MSGFLRRITRSRPADAGEALQEGRAAETEGAAPTAETPPGSLAAAGAPGPVDRDAAPSERVEVAEATSGEAPEATSGDETPAIGSDPAATTSVLPAVPTAKRSRWRPFRRRSKRATTAQPVPVLLADPSVPAGVDLAEQPLRPPSGRRGRLRRRLRYLRRARELMLRDLGGLLYEVHRTGGGNLGAHTTVVDAKVQRIVGVDAEAHALEAALSAQRAETVVFEPGVGGTCVACGELHGSDARFCSNCGTAIGGAAVAEAPEIVSEPARTAFWRRAARPAEAQAGATAAPSDETAVRPQDEAATSAGQGGPEPDAGAPDTATSDQQTAADAPGESPRDESASERPAGNQDVPRNPHAGVGNGRPGEQPQPPGSPLVSRERP